MIIDCHCHAGKGDRMTAPWNTEADIGPYLRRARAAGIAKTIVVAVFHSDYNKANAEVASIIARHPDRLIGFVYVLNAGTGMPGKRSSGNSQSGRTPLAFSGNQDSWL